MPGFSTRDVHVLVRQGASVLDVPGVSVTTHQVRDLAPGVIRLFNDLRITLPARAFVDAATWAGDEWTASRLIVAGAQHGLAHPLLMREEILARPRARHRRLLLLLCNDLEGGAQALSEVEFLKFCRRHGLPRPMLQTRMDTAGRRRYLDATFRRRDGSHFHVEVDGGVHLKLEVRARDDLKDNDARLSNRLVLRYASVLIYTDNPEAIRQIRTALADV